LALPDNPQNRPQRWGSLPGKLRAPAAPEGGSFLHSRGGRCPQLHGSQEQHNGDCREADRRKHPKRIDIGKQLNLVADRLPDPFDGLAGGLGSGGSFVFRISCNSK